MQRTEALSALLSKLNVNERCDSAVVEVNTSGGERTGTVGVEKMAGSTKVDIPKPTFLDHVNQDKVEKGIESCKGLEMEGCVVKNDEDVKLMEARVLKEIYVNDDVGSVVGGLKSKEKAIMCGMEFALSLGIKELAVESDAKLVLDFMGSPVNQTSPMLQVYVIELSCCIIPLRVVVMLRMLYMCQDG
ncbi:uncharacterized protein G2W53_032498 [Senna tora]|uniref:RNase H type-1 domain-containing protein n=1 Tax=Senna tora TaxID=362788 RepID=A0A834W714_9FABA|nr:uncharacterized protein G2W53_032498 [Senna tora]